MGIANEQLPPLWGTLTFTFNQQLDVTYSSFKQLLANKSEHESGHIGGSRLLDMPTMWARHESSQLTLAKTVFLM